MKYMLIVVLSVLGMQAHADLDDVKDLGSKAHVSNQCAGKMLRQATQQCNTESKQKDQDREHDCFYSYDMSGVTLQHPNEGTLEVVFTVGDDDVWSYLVYVTDEADQNDCSFTIKSENN